MATSVAALAVVVAGLVPGAGAAQSSDPRAERERVRTDRAQVASEVNALEASSEEVSSALADLEANVSDQQNMLADARLAAEQAAESLATAKAEEQEAEGEISELEALVRDIAVEQYMRPTSLDPMVVLSSESVSEASRRNALLDFRSQRDADVLDELRSAREDVELRRQEAQRATERAEQERVEVAGRVDQLEGARDQQASFAASVEDRLDATLAEAASLADLDADLAAQIAADEARVAAQLRAAREARDAAAARSRTSSGSASSSGASSASSGPAARAAPRAAASIAGSGPIVSVNGIQVSTQIADNLRAMLDAASADGINLSGGGFRDPSAQIALRRSNCGSSDYSVYSAPASSCSPPTARPGSSMHEQGLAVDFTYNGSLISSRSNAGYGWLAGNASRFGFFNLPSEPWHWSVNGN